MCLRGWWPGVEGRVEESESIGEFPDATVAHPTGVPVLPPPVPPADED